MAGVMEAGVRWRRKLVIHDSLAFLSLVALTVVLFGVTLFLFRSFSGHRTDLARSSAEQGQRAMAAGRPEDAIGALRTALSYAPGTRAYELLLARALGEAGHTEESLNYYQGLWEATPGDGEINLQMARLAAKKGDRQQAVNFYRAAIYGAWDGSGGSGSGVVRRAEGRLELARYLIAGQMMAAARMELLIAGGNAPESEEFDLTVAQLLEQAGDSEDAWTYYGKTLGMNPDDLAAQEEAGKLAFAAGEFREAQVLLRRAAKNQPPSGYDIPSPPSETWPMAWQTDRIVELTPWPELPAEERVKRTMAARTIAKARLAGCEARFTAGVGEPGSLEALDGQWAVGGGTGTEAKGLGGSEAVRRTMVRDPEQQREAMRLVYDTEVETAKACGEPPQGWDALLLTMARAATMPKTLDVAKMPLALRAQEIR